SGFRSSAKVMRSVPSSCAGPRCVPLWTQTNAGVGQHALELVDLTISMPPFSLGRKSFDPFDQHTPVPRPVENDYLTLVRQMAPESLQATDLMLVELMDYSQGAVGNAFFRDVAFRAGSWITDALWRGCSMAGCFSRTFSL